MSELLSVLRSRVDAGELRPLDYQFGRFLQQKGASDLAVLAGTLVSAELAQGNVCLVLSRLPELSPELKQLTVQLGLSTLGLHAQIIGDGSETTPLVLNGERLYLHRYWSYEVMIAASLHTRAARSDVDLETLRSGLNKLFGRQTGEPDWQKVAAAIAAQRRFSVISGGPGTGKTTTVTKLLALICEQSLQLGREPVIKLAAPTGKAAARLSESIAGAVSKLPLSVEQRASIPADASTLHRLLGVIPNSHSFRHNAENPLHLDLLVVDEASMIDLPMMARLLDALPDSARLILIGDRDQLASVEAGSVLGDICRWPGEVGYSAEQGEILSSLCDISAADISQNYPSPLADSVALLRKSYRFHDQSGIGHLARAVNTGDVARFTQVLKSANFGDIELNPLTSEGYAALIARAVEGYSHYLRCVDDNATPEHILAQFNRLQLLCALREGPYGVAGLNETIRSALAKRRLVSSEGQWFSGRPVIITRNDSVMELYNGDIGITLPDEDGNLRVWFEQSGRMRAVLPSRLPEHETVFAMTVHKSQGSEFEQVLLLLPPDDSPVLTRELLYTGITRAKQSLALYGTDRIFRQATLRPTERNGGLADRLWQM